MERYVLQADLAELEEHFDASADSEISFEKNFNVTPGSKMPICTKPVEKISIVEATWGIKTDNGEELFSISQKDLLESKALKPLAENSPCIIPASGFYKWKHTVKDPLPFYLRVLTMEILPLAGIYSSHENDNGEISYSFAVVTMPANALVEPLDKSMPCILKPSEHNTWLGSGAVKMLQTGFKGQSLLPDMAVYRVPDLVNDTSNNSPELIQPIPKLRDDDDDD